MHYLYAFKILPTKNEYKESTSEYYKQKRKNNMIFEELNFLARNSFKSINEVEEYKVNLEKQLPELKGKREDLWGKYHIATNENDRNIIKKEIDKLTEKIDTFISQKNVCNRIIGKYSVIREKRKKEIENKAKSQEQMKKDKNDKIK